MSVHDKWRGTAPRSKLRWRVRYRNSGGEQRAKDFASKRAADDFDARMKIAPEEVAADVLVDDLCAVLLATKRHLAPKTREAAAGAVKHVLAEFGGRAAASVSPSEVRVWISGMPGSGSLRAKALNAASSAFALAVRDGTLRVNPCADITVSQGQTREGRFLTPVELRQLAAAAGDDGLMVELMGMTGLRIGEACGLDVDDLNVARSRIRVAKGATNGLVGETKTRRARDIPIPASLAARLAAHVGDRTVGPLFTSPHGDRINSHNWRERVFYPAVAAAGLSGVRPHDLRHTAVSLAIRAGADVKAVQNMVGHASATLTLSTYSHLWGGGLDDVAARMDRIYAEEAS